MLQPIETAIPDPIERLFCPWNALDPDSGAFLFRTNGRGKGGLPTYVLIKPNKTVAVRGGLFTPYQWDYPTGRKFIRAWTLEEAIEIGNQRLAKMMRQSAQKAA
jgi:hypothetical protein